MTRIIAGIHKGRRLAVPDGTQVRPTTDRMRERLFSMLMHSRYPDINGAFVADIFAGTGALGLESLSRGATHTTFVEKSPGPLATLKNNISLLKVENQTDILQTSARALPPARRPYDFIFMDPPYRMGLAEPALASLLENGWLAPNGVIICELATDDDTCFPPELELVDERTQGQQRMVFLKQS